MLFEPYVDDELHCCYRRNWGRSGVAAASSATRTEKSRWKAHQQAHQRHTRATPPSTLPLTTMHSIRQAGSGYVARDVTWLQRGTRLGRGVFYAASTTNAYATIRRVVEERDPAEENATGLVFGVGPKRGRQRKDIGRSRSAVVVTMTSKMQ